jgi:hypothetical protein
MTGFRSPAIDRHAAAVAIAAPAEPRDLTGLTPDEFRTLTAADLNRLFQQDPGEYRRLRDAR